MSSTYTLIRSPASPLRFPLHCNIPTSSRDVNSTENLAIEVSNLSYSVTSNTKHGGQVLPILKNCSIQVPSGQLWMLLGPNGCGKSTLLNILAGLLVPSDGHMYVKMPKSFVFQNPDHQILAGLLVPSDGHMYVKMPKSFVFQNPDHQVIMPTVEADVAFGIGKFNLTDEEVRSRVSKALDAVGMYKYMQAVQTLSGGQKQRVAIAGALAEACKVLLLEELTTFLDETDQIGVIKAVKDTLRNSEEVTALWVTHRLEELEYADGAFYMEDGKVSMQGNAASIMDFIKGKQSSYTNQINT